MKNKALATILISALLASAVAGVFVVRFGMANPYLGVSISPPVGMKVPVVTIYSPENNTISASNQTMLSFFARVGESTASYDRLAFTVSYEADWQENATILYRTVFLNNDNEGITRIDLALSDIPDGNHEILIYAEELGQIVTQAVYPNMGLIQTFSVNNSAVINFKVDTVSPTIIPLSIRNETYPSSSSIALNFIVSESVSQLFYILDNQANVTIDGNLTLSDLAVGVHNVTVYAKDFAGNIGVSKTISFTVAKPESSESLSALLVVASVIVVVVVVCLGLLVYLKKRQRDKSP
jgi:hypothetical protein